MTRGACQHRDDAGAWVLGALAEADAHTFARHLEGCDDCRAEVAELQVVADVLPLASPQLLPPPELKSRIMRIVEAEAELLRAAGPEADRPVRPAPRRRRGWLGGLRPGLAVGLACAVVAIAVAVGVLASTGGGDVREIRAQAPPGAQVALRVEGDRGELQIERMPAPPPGRVYQVWLVRGKGTPEPTRTLFTVPSDGRAKVTIDEPLDDADQVLVSDEPDGGSAQPTGSVVVNARLT
jgi:anti-sigma-K factor RskA